MRILTLLLAALLLPACTDSSSPSPQTGQGAAAANLDTITVDRAMVPRETLFDGVIEALNQSTVAAQTSGRVTELPFDVGDYVEQGAVIARLTGKEQAASVSAAEGNVAEANAQLAEARQDHRRNKEVYDKGLIAKAQYDRVVAKLKSAEARLKAAEAALSAAQESLGYTEIRAPYAGTVVARHVQLGETVGPGIALMTGLSLEHLRVVVDIPQLHIGPLRKHGKARVILPDGESVQAAEMRIPPSADTGSHSFRVLITLPQNNYGSHDVFPGTLVKVAFVTGREQRLLVPASALVRRGEVTGVYVLDDEQKLSLRYVRIGSTTTDNRVPVLSGLVDNERIAIDPVAAAVAYKQQNQPASES